MAWATEFLGDVGTVNGTNKTFTLTHAPLFVLALGFPFTLLHKVTSQPNEMEYAISGTTLALGLGPTDPRAWIIYWYEDA